MKILLAHTKEITGSTFYRQEMPLEHLKLKHGVEVQPIEHVERMPVDLFQRFDIVYFSRQLMPYKAATVFDAQMLAARIRAAGCKIVLDIDDYWILSHSHASKKGYQEQGQVAKIISSIQEADLITTTNELLASKILPYNSNVVVLPNALDPSIRTQYIPEPTKSDKIRFGWFGSLMHEEDLRLMEHSITKLHGNPSLKGKYQLVFGGYVPGHPLSERFENIFTSNGKAPEGAYRRIEYAGLNEYAKGYNEVDVILAPLNDNTFNNCKSELKLIEAGFMGKAAIVSAIHPYTNVIDYVNCVSIPTEYNMLGWYKAMRNFINMPKAGMSTAKALQIDVTERYHLDVVNPKRHDALKALVEEKALV